jgi:hypothetical protein
MLSRIVHFGFGGVGFHSVEMSSWYPEIEMMVLGFIGLSVLLLLFVLARRARRFNIGPNWLRQFAIDKRTLY